MRRMYSKPQLLEAVEQEAEVNGLKVFENIVDKDGYKRFIEGDIEVVDALSENKIYGKWSLSGSHLSLVLCLSGSENDTISGNITKPIALPSWVLTNIHPLGSTVVDLKSFNWFGSDNTTQSVSVYLEKASNNLRVYSNSITLTKNRNVRMAFDLLIDNE